MRTKKSNTPFRFPFDINPRVFIAFAIFFFVLSFDSIRYSLFPPHTLSAYQEKITKYLNKNLDEFSKKLDNPSFVNSLINNKLSNKEINEINKFPYDIFLYQQDSLIYWSTNEVLPDISNPQAANASALELKKGKYIQFIKNIRYNNSLFKAICILKLKNENPYKSDNFKNSFAVGDKENDFAMKLSVIKQNGSLPIKYQNQIVYYLYRSDDYFGMNDKSGWRLFLHSLPFIFFGISIHTYFKVKAKSASPSLIFLALLTTALSIRALGYFFNLPTNFEHFELFDSTNFATDILNKSLGETFINMCLYFWILLFFTVNVQFKVFIHKLKSTTSKTIFGLLVLVFLILQNLYLSNLIYKLIYDSIINFDTTIFSHINLISFIGILTFMVIFANFYLTVILANNYFVYCFKIAYLKYILIGIICISFELFYSKPYPINYYFIFIIIGVIIFLLDKPIFKLKFDFNSYSLIVWIILISLTGSLIITNFVIQKEESNRAEYALKLFANEDKQIEDKISIVAQTIANDSVVVSLLNKSNRKNQYDIEDYIQNKIIGNKFLKYKSKFQYFNKNNQNLDISDTTKFLTIEQFKHQNPIIFETKFVYSGLIKSNIEKGYLFYIPVKYMDKTGAVVVHLTQNILPSKNDYTDFLYHDEFTKRAIDYNYSIGVYDNNIISIKTGTYEYPSQLKNDLKLTTNQPIYQNQGSYNIMLVKDHTSNKVISIVKKSNKIYLTTTLFAYIFLIYFLTLTLYILGNIIARSNLNTIRFINLLNINLQLKINISIIVLSLFSFIVIGIYVSKYIINGLIEKSKTQISHYSQSLEKDITKYLSKTNSIQSLHIDSVINLSETQEELNSLAQKFQTAVHIFDPQNGSLLFTTDKKIFSNGLLSTKINPLAFHFMKAGGKSQIINKESIGSLEYFSAYTRINNSNQIPIGIIQIPYLSANTEIKSETSTLIISLINVFVLVLLISSLLAIFLTNSVTRPFRYIVKQFTKINLSKTNEPLKWNYNDEIGLLVKEYNRMLRKLENSTLLLAKNEREMAWREMAKQVAHEIKNPLTPMKLSLQMLERAIKNNNPNVLEMTSRVTKTTIEQIETLTLIATNFSNFAKMPEMHKEYIVLNEILYSVTGMYNDDLYNEFLFLIPEFNINVFADKNQLIRVFTNIIQNAIQSIPSYKKGNISLTVSKAADNLIRVSISDNGEGISIEKSKQMFQPYFTTKTSGTGLGLAMCKDIIEQFGGKIWFESTLNEGTTFHIELRTEYEEDNEYYKNRLT